MEETSINLLNPETNPPRKTWRYVFLFLLTLLILVVIGWAAFAIFNNEPTNTTGLNQKKPGFFTQIKNLILSSDRQLKGEAEDRINILLLGIGGEGHDGPYLTDTMILASLKPSTNQIAMLSIPRDLLVNIPGYGYRKINNADAFGETQKPGYGPILTADVVQTILQQPIHYYIRVDFKAFKDIIDEFGGVKVNVERSFIDNEYPTYDFKVQTISFEKGLQTMDGETALRFARSRHGGNGEGSDFARSKRQQEILTALKDEVFSSSLFTNAGRIQGIVGSLNQNLQTNAEMWEVNKFYKLAKRLDYENLINRVLEAGHNQPLVENMYNGASVVEPRLGNFDELARIAANLFAEGKLTIVTPPPAPAEPAKTAGPKVELQNGTWVLGLAAKTKAELESQGVKIETVGNAKIRNYNKTIVYDFSQGKFAADLDKLKTALQAEVITHPQPQLFTSTTPDILIIAGMDRNK